MNILEKYMNDTKYEGKFLASKVLAVAVINDDPPEYVSEWAAYIGATETNDFEKEFMKIAKRGTKLPRAIASILFPDVPKKKRWRY